MRNWCKLLPYFLIEWYMLRYGERLCIGEDDIRYVQPFGPGFYGNPKRIVLIEVDPMNRRPSRVLPHRFD